VSIGVVSDQVGRDQVGRLTDSCHFDFIMITKGEMRDA
jgi:hypothetical protein